ncbi:DUF2975 domain-containing protein [Kitasatospora sp. NPDC002965]|uniref:DUF2975 domain-containing protein n=1 Tax=unclassified Kitasatospora TaxID=2633591 RepID=UPI0033B5F871
MSLLGKLRRPDWLGELQGVLTLGLVATSLAIAVSVGRALLGDLPVTAGIPAGALEGSTVIPGRTTGGVSITPDSVIEVEIADPSAHQLVAAVLTALPSLLVALGMLVMLLLVVRRARRGDPFTTQAVRRLRLLAVFVIVGGTLAGVTESAAALDLALSVSDTAGVTVWEFPAAWTLAGFGILASAEVVSRGAGMRAELETVI